MTRLARSAPLMPGVPRATTVEVDVGRDPLVLAVHLQDGEALLEVGQRAPRSGGRSGPGRSRAGSRMSGRLVAAIITMPSVVSKPSISASIWLSVCSRSSWPPPRPAPRLRPMESISSTKMMAGACLRAVWNRSRTRDAPTPTNISMKSEPVTDRNGTPGLAGHGPGQQRLAGARRADQQHALGDAGADLLEAVGRSEEVDDLADLQLDAVVAGHVGEGGPRPLGRVHLGLGAPDRHDAGHLALGPAAHPEEEADDQRPVEQEGQQRRQQVAALVDELQVLDVGAAAAPWCCR